MSEFHECAVCDSQWCKPMGECVRQHDQQCINVGAMSGVEITQADRDAAQEWAGDVIAWDDRDLTLVLSDLAEDFARHRQSATAPLIAALEEAREALDLFARLELPSRPSGNAGFYSIPFARIEKARAALTRITETLAKHKGAEDA